MFTAETAHIHMFAVFWWLSHERYADLIWWMCKTKDERACEMALACLEEQIVAEGVSHSVGRFVPKRPLEAQILLNKCILQVPPSDIIFEASKNKRNQLVL